VFVVDDLAGWLIGRLADAGYLKLITLMRGSDQARALKPAVTAAVQATVAQIGPPGGEEADRIAEQINKAFRRRDPVPLPPGQATVLEALQAGIAGQLSVLDDAGQPVVNLPGVPVSEVAVTLTGHLVREIMISGSGGGPLAPLADQLNHDVTHLQGERLEGMLAQLAAQVTALARAGGGAQARRKPVRLPPQVSLAAEPLIIAAKNPRPLFGDVGVGAFTGREWLIGQVDGFIAGNPRGYVFVEAEAGLGKTVFAAWLVKTRGYLSHFSRYSDGRSVREALKNLSAQLIMNFGLDDQAPGGMLPGWFQAPSGFESLLTAAADHASGQGRLVVLVVDGLDEAEVPGQGLPWGLPSLLPDGVYVIGTYRTGWAAQRPDPPMATLGIGKEDERNQRDIVAYLAKTVGEEVLATRLANAGMSQAEFISLLAGRCDGVWVYLRYVLDELRLGLRSPSEISDLPTGLRNYYAKQIRAWQQDRAWNTGLLPLLATLGVAGEALPAAALARLAGNVDPVAIRRWCDLTIRPLLTAGQGSAAGMPLRYEIYHASLRELLTGHSGNPPAGPGDQHPFDLVALADELGQAALTAHNRICDTYLACFGGLESALPALAEDPGGGEIDGGYPLRHLARHLCQAGRTAHLHALLAAEHPVSENHAVNTWFAAHDHADTIISYLNDLSRARDDSATVTDHDLARHRPAPAFGMQIRYALMAASIASFTANVSDDLLRQLISAGVWSPQHALNHARRIADPGKRADALLTAHNWLSADEQPAVSAEALAAAAAITDEYTRAQALTELALHLPADQQPTALAQALAAATAVSDGSSRVQALTALAPHLPTDQRPTVLAQALATANALPQRTSRALALAALAPHLPAVSARALTAAISLTGDAESSERARALAALVPQLPAKKRPAVVAQALAAVIATGDDSTAEVLPALAPYLPATLLPQALAVAAALPPNVEALATLVPHLPTDQQPAVLAQALTDVTAIPLEGNRARDLAALAPYLPTELLAQALTTATALTFDAWRAHALTGLAPYLPSDQQPVVLAQALAAATAIPNGPGRAEALTGLAPHLPTDQQPAVLAQALTAATAIADDYYRAQALTGLAPHLPTDQRPAVLAQALTAAISREYNRDEALTRLAPLLPAELLPQALAAATALPNPVETLAALAPYLPADQQPAVLAQALADATAISFGFSRAEALTALAPHLPAELLAQALAAATAIADDYYRVRALTGLVSHLPVGQQPTVLAQALVTAAALGNDSLCAGALTALAPRLPTDQQPAVFAEALAAAAAEPSDWSRAEALIKLAPHLPAELLPQALAAASADPDDWSRARELTALAPHLPAELLPQALATATAFTDDYSRIWALTGLLPHLPADQQPAVLAQALATATAFPEGPARAETLTWLAPCLPADQQAAVSAQVLATATTLPNLFRTRVLTGLAPHLPAELLAQALAAATTLPDDSRTRALAALVPHLPAELLPQALATAPKTSIDTLTAILDRGRAVLLPEDPAAYVKLFGNSLIGTERRAVFGVIAAIAPTIADLGGLRAIEECIDAVGDVQRWWP
jgi:hypothetical protein